MLFNAPYLRIAKVSGAYDILTVVHLDFFLGMSKRLKDAPWHMFRLEVQ